MARSEEVTENHHLTLQFPSDLMSVLASIESLFRFSLISIAAVVFLNTKKNPLLIYLLNTKRQADKINNSSGFNVSLKRYWWP